MITGVKTHWASAPGLGLGLLQFRDQGSIHEMVTLWEGQMALSQLSESSRKDLPHGGRGVTYPAYAGYKHSRSMSWDPTSGHHSWRSSYCPSTHPHTQGVGN